MEKDGVEEIGPEVKGAIEDHARQSGPRELFLEGSATKEGIKGEGNGGLDTGREGRWKKLGGVM